MVERAEFGFSHAQSLIFGVVFLALAGVIGVRLFPSGLPELNGNTTVLLLAVAAMAGFGLWSLANLRRTSVIVTVDRDGITDTRLMADPIRWADVERCALVAGMKGARHLQLVLRPDSRAATRLGKRKVFVNDLVLKGGGGGVRGAIARLAPQVPRDW